MAAEEKSMIQQALEGYSDDDKNEEDGKKSKDFNPADMGDMRGVLVNGVSERAEGLTMKPIKVVSNEILHHIADLHNEKPQIFHVDGLITKYNYGKNELSILSKAESVNAFINHHIICYKISPRKVDGQIVLAQLVDQNTSKYASYIYEFMDDEISKKFNRIKGIMTHPYFDKDFSIVSDSGYNKDTEFLLPEHFAEEVIDMSIEDAMNVFDKTLGKMHHATDADYQMELVRFVAMPWRYICKRLPMFAINANVPGAGKSLSCRIMNKIWCKDKGKTISLLKDNNELDKQLFGGVLSGIPMLIIDNVNRKLDNEKICIIITEEKISGRVFYTNELKEVDNYLMLTINGNNVEMSGELVSRSVKIDYNVTQRDEVRDYSEGERGHEIEQYCIDNRSEVISASLAISKRYIQDGCPTYKDVTGWSRFPMFSEYVLGTVAHLKGIVDDSRLSEIYFKQKFEESKIQADDEFVSWSRAVKAIIDVVGIDEEDDTQTNLFISETIFRLLSYEDSFYDRNSHYPECGYNIMGEYINGYRTQDRSKAVGLLLRKYKGKVACGWQLQQTNMKLKDRWRGYKSAFRLVIVDDKHYMPGDEGDPVTAPVRVKVEKEYSETVGEPVDDDDDGIAL